MPPHLMCSRLVLFALIFSHWIGISGCDLLKGDSEEEWDILITLSGTFENDLAHVFLNDELIFADSLQSLTRAASDLQGAPDRWIEQTITNSDQRLSISINGETAGTFTFNAYSRRFVWCTYDQATRRISFTSYREPIPVER